MWKRTPIVSKSKLWLLVFIALMALAEKGPQVIGIPQGASPLSVWSLGTFDFYDNLKENYSYVIAVTSLDQLEYPDGYEYCLFITISPEKPYSLKEAEHVINKLSKCEKPALLIADEFNTSNVLLEAAGLPARVAEGCMLYNYSEPALGERFHLSPYVKATFKLRGDEIIDLTLDKASYVEGGFVVLGYADNVVIYRFTDNSWIPASRVPIAVYVSNGNFRGIVVSDGSIFLNQVLRSRYGGQYARVLFYFVDYLCNFDKGCAIAIDASRYDILDAESLFKNTTSSIQASISSDIVLASVLYALKLIHPSTWFIPLIKYIGEVSLYFLNTPPFSYILFFFVVVLVSSFVLRKTGERARDERSVEIKEVELFVSADLLNAISKGKYKLARSDFVSLYEIVDTYLKYALGQGLLEEGIVDLLSKYVKREKALKYVRNMNKLYYKAKGKRRLPLVLSWHRTVEKYLKLSEEILKTIGFSLEAEKGYEYIAMVYKR